LYLLTALIALALLLALGSEGCYQPEADDVVIHNVSVTTAGEALNVALFLTARFRLNCLGLSGMMLL